MCSPEFPRNLRVKNKILEDIGYLNEILIVPVPIDPRGKIE